MLTLGSIILVHGLRGHLLKTWACSKAASVEHTLDKRAIGSSTLRQKVKSHFRFRVTPSEDNSIKEERSSRPQSMFWPQDYLAKDILKAKV